MNGESDQISNKLNALLAFAAASYQPPNGEGRKPEEILATCGIKPDEAAVILGKNEAAIRKTIHRSGIRLRRSRSNKK